MSATKEKLHDVIEQGMRNKKINTLELFKKLHESEINFQISSFWDSVFTFKIGDEMNDFKDEFKTDSFEEGLNWLENQAKIIYPDSKFTKEDYKSSFEDAVRPLMKYLGKNHHPHTIAYVRNDLAELAGGQKVFETDDYILD